MFSRSYIMSYVKRLKEEIEPVRVLSRGENTSLSRYSFLFRPRAIEHPKPNIELTLVYMLELTNFEPVLYNDTFSMPA